jgi:RNA polymerase sigma-B factor
MNRVEIDEVWLADALARYAQTRAVDLRDEIVEGTLWLATRSARRFATSGEPFDDLVQVARIGLLKAVERFDASHAVPFGAYATPTIMGELRRYFRDHTWSVHVSRRAKDLRSSLNTTAETMSRELNRSPRVSELAERLGISEEHVIETLEANNAYRSYSLDPAGMGRTAVAESRYDDVLNRDVVIGLLSQLPQREREILTLRFFNELTQAEIAERIGTSQVHVGRLIASSLAKLRPLLDGDSGSTPPAVA